MLQAGAQLTIHCSFWDIHIGMLFLTKQQSLHTKYKGQPTKAMLTRRKQSVTVALIQDERCCTPRLTPCALAFHIFWGGYYSFCSPHSLQNSYTGNLIFAKKWEVFMTAGRGISTILQYLASVVKLSLAQSNARQLWFLTCPCSSRKNQKQKWDKYALRTAAEDNSISTAKWQKQLNKKMKQQGGEAWTEWEEKNMRKRRGMSYSRNKI